jgi:hypothetical protein
MHTSVTPTTHHTHTISTCLYVHAQDIGEYVDTLTGLTREPQTAKLGASASSIPTG